MVAGGVPRLGALAVFAGLVDAAYVGHVDAQLSRSLNLDSVAAAVIGGVALTGGRGHIGQTVVGWCCWPCCSSGCSSWAPARAASSPSRAQ